MRTTLDIDDDVLAAAKDLAQAEDVSVGQMVSRLVRRALTIAEPAGSSGFAEAPMRFDHGSPADRTWLVLPDRGGAIVGPSMIADVQTALDREDIAAAMGSPDRPAAPAPGGTRRKAPTRTR
jgi:hypothetical protein